MVEGRRHHRSQQGSLLKYRHDGSDDTTRGDDGIPRNDLVHLEKQDPSDLSLFEAGLQVHLQVETELWSKEWHDSFLRNGFVDFVPPLSEKLDCMVIGDGISMPLPPWQDGTKNLDAVKSKHVLRHSSVDQSTIEQEISAQLKLEKRQHQNLEDDGHPYSDSDLTKLDSISAMGKSLLDFEGKYDCLFDHGWMEAALRMGSHQGAIQASVILQEATRVLKEHGIYVIVTQEPIPLHVQEYLLQVGDVIGLQWQFGLDGLSGDEQSISVARKYFTGELPSFGKLAKIPVPGEEDLTLEAEMD